MKQEVEEWEIKVDDYEKLSVDVLSKILAEGEKYFDSLVDDHNSLSNKSFTILSILITVLAVLVSFILDKIGEPLSINSKAIILIVFTLLGILSYCICLLLLIIYPKEMMGKGDLPKPINYNDLIKIKKDDQLFIFIYNSIGTIQTKIDFNRNLYQTRIDKFERILQISSITFILTLIVITIIFFTQ